MSFQEIEIPTLVHESAQPPNYTTEGASGADVRAHLEAPLTLQPGCHTHIPTGLKFAIPEGYEIQVRPRSGLAFKHGLTVLNSPGTIDADYRGELQVLLVNHGQQPFTIEPGMRIAQLVVAPVVQARFVLHEELATSERGSGGLGHTGIH